MRIVFSNWASSRDGTGPQTRNYSPPGPLLQCELWSWIVCWPLRTRTFLNARHWRRCGDSALKKKSLQEKLVSILGKKKRISIEETKPKRFGKKQQKTTKKQQKKETVVYLRKQYFSMKIFFQWAIAIFLQTRIFSEREDPGSTVSYLTYRKLCFVWVFTHRNFVWCEEFFSWW